MKLLILGGTMFLGRHIVEAALRRDHEVTLFNRGQHHSHLFPEVEKLHGDRDGGLAVLEGRTWDGVIDTCGYVPRVVKASAELLAGAVDHYTFISSISVYSDFSQVGMDENGPKQTLSDPTVEEVTGEVYGGLKFLCEQAAEAAMPERVLNLRPGLIVGPYDYIPRFAYWLQRVAKAGEVLAPGPPARRVQLIDARDLADWIVRMGETRTTGTFNATGPDHPLTMQQFLETIRTISNSQATFTWMAESFLLEHDVRPFDEMPFWMPEATQGALEINIDKALAAGLTFRPLAETVKDTLNWLTTTQLNDKAGDLSLMRSQTGMSPEREAELLKAWQQRL